MARVFPDEMVENSDGVMLSVSIVNYNTSGFTKNAVESILGQTEMKNYEIIVVDNGSRDEGIEDLGSFDQRVSVINAGENLGFARANNLAFSRSKGKYFLMLNPDTQIVGSALDDMVTYMEKNQHCAVLGPRLLNKDGSLQYSCRTFPGLVSVLFTMTFLEKIFPRSPLFGRYRMTYWGHDREREVDQPMGACLLFRSDIYSRYGMLDERYFMYYEEVDLCKSIKSGGHRICFIPHAEVIHFENQSSKQDPIAASQYYFKSMVEYFRKNHGSLHVFAVKLMIYLGLALRIPLNFLQWLRSGKNKQEEYARRLSMFSKLLFKIMGY